MFWIIVLNIVMNNGDVYTEIQYPKTPEYNNEKTCNEVGQVLVDQRQIEIGTNSGKAYFTCKSITVKEIDAALGRTNT
jgi:hypothetical protein